MSEIFKIIKTNEILRIVEFIKKSDELSSAQQNPSRFFAKFGINLPTNHQYELYLNDDTTLYMVVPTQDNIELTTEILAQFYAGAIKKPTVGTASSIGSSSSISTASSVSGTWGSSSSIATLGCAGSLSTAKS